MTDDIRDRARQALEGITPGRWQWGAFGSLIADESESVIYADSMTEGIEADNPDDADFIAAAPALVRELLDDWGVSDECVLADSQRLADENLRLRTELDAAHESAAQWEALWRQDLATTEQALRERDQALAEVERLRGNQRVEIVEGWHGKCRGVQ